MRPKLDARAGFSGEETSPSVQGMPWRRPRQVQEAEAAARLSQPIPAQLVCLQQPWLQGPGRDTSLSSPRPQHGCSGALLLPSHIQSLTSSLLGSRRSSSSTIKPEQPRGTPWLAQAALPLQGAEFGPTPLLPLLAGVKPALPMLTSSSQPRSRDSSGCRALSFIFQGRQKGFALWLELGCASHSSPAWKKPTSDGKWCLTPKLTPRELLPPGSAWLWLLPPASGIPCAG